MVCRKSQMFLNHQIILTFVSKVKVKYTYNHVVLILLQTLLCLCWRIFMFLDDKEDLSMVTGCTL